jgi:hypothetical protein
MPDEPQPPPAPPPVAWQIEIDAGLKNTDDKKWGRDRLKEGIDRMHLECKGRAMTPADLTALSSAIHKFAAINYGLAPTAVNLDVGIAVTEATPANLRKLLNASFTKLAVPEAEAEVSSESSFDDRESGAPPRPSED